MVFEIVLLLIKLYLHIQPKRLKCSFPFFIRISEIITVKAVSLPTIEFIFDFYYVFIKFLKFTILYWRLAELF